MSDKIICICGAEVEKMHSHCFKDLAKRQKELYDPNRKFTRVKLESSRPRTMGSIDW